MRVFELAMTLAIVLATVPVGQAAAPAPADGLIASPEAGWPQWRGARRDGISQEKGLLQAWPEGGPTVLWTAADLGRGWSSPIIAGGAIYITGDVGDDLRIVALDLDGKKKWEATNGAAWKEPHPGARASCAYAAGRLYHMNAHGRVACLDAATGKEVWAVNVLERFAGRQITWALSECLLVDGPRVIVTPGGDKAFMAALNKDTGETVWTSAPLPEAEIGTRRTGYASPILVRFGGRRLIVTMGLRCLVCVDADTGRLQWVFPKRTKHDAPCMTPAYAAGGVFGAMPTQSGGVFLRLVAGGDTVGYEKVWECPMDNLGGGAVVVDGLLYGSGHTNAGWVCMDVATGEQKYIDKTLSQGAVVYADGRLYCLAEEGDMALVKPGPQGFGIASRFRLVPGKCKDAWAHPVILDKRLYLRYHDRYHDRLYCYDIARPGGGP